MTSSYYLIEDYLDTDTIGEFILKFKNNNNLTLKDISNMTGFSVSHISNLVHGKLPSIKLIKSIDKLKRL
ncbi:helix-turn-helix transcriptional regulator [[Eubacterium] tenue]|nr:helix-turn-helix transcriptional regulator [[Eubacterium] tenue]MBC8630496.1 helix-turn-helix transcriptional regulator [[Eubacterium] tenue]